MSTSKFDSKYSDWARKLLRDAEELWDHLRTAYNYNEIIQMGMDKSTIAKCDHNDINPDDVCYINFSSGTTGKPKAVISTHFQVVNNSFTTAKRIELNKKHHSICVLVPLFHGFGTIVTIAGAIHSGATLVLPSLHYNSTNNYKAIKDRRCSYIFGTPTMFKDLISIQENFGEKVNAEFALLGAAPIPPELLEKIKTQLNIGCVKVAYGLTETSTTVFVSCPGSEPENDTVGYLGDHLQVKIIDRIGETVPVGKPGEICIRGYSVMLGYWNDEENTKKVIQDDGWFKTGDIGILQNNGYAKIVGRKTDLIIRGGENIYPKEVEDILNTHCRIEEAQVIGIPHDRLGEEICACIKLTTGFEMTRLQVADFCKNKLAHNKIPTKVIVVQEFPKTLSGKVQKNLLRKKICDDLYNSK